MISGYSVVSLPESNCDSNADIKVFRKPPETNGILYGGYMREPFMEIGLLSVRGKLPPNIASIYKEIEASEVIHPNYYSVTGSYEHSKILKEYSESIGEKCEIIALGSSSLQSRMGEVKSPPINEFMGYDFSTGGYSGILTCLFEKTKYFESSVNAMNKNGLFDDINLVDETAKRYLSLQSTKSDIENIFLEDVETVYVYRIPSSNP
jgi:hypothetical protein